MQVATVQPGYIGTSKGDTSLNAIIWGGGEDFWFFPVSPWEAPVLDQWLLDGKEFLSLFDILPNLSDEERKLFLYGGDE